MGEKSGVFTSIVLQLATFVASAIFMRKFDSGCGYQTPAHLIGAKFRRLLVSKLVNRKLSWIHEREAKLGCAHVH